ncbi:MAG: hypothetical protein PHH26_07915 [Candidatus Thermoplasmatota archaeon]|nr:hypothetical protein [Candidatus Thermoplasmatota archaeon]
MKSILAIFVIGLLLATAFSGCVGGEKTSGNGTTDENGADGGMPDSGSTGGNSTGNATSGNATDGNETVPENYHQEYSNTILVVDAVQGDDIYTFPVQNIAKKIVLVLTATALPGVTGTCIKVTDPKGNELASDASNGDAVTIEISQEDIAKAKSGKWTADVYLGVPDLQCDYTLTIDVIYS